MKFTLAVLALTFSSLALADTKTFTCSVESFDGQTGWKQSQGVVLKAEVKNFNGKQAATSGVIKINESTEAVVDVSYQAETVNNDDISTKKDPKILLVARIQNTLRGNTKIVSMASEVVGRPDEGSSWSKKIYVTSQLNNTDKYSAFLSNSGASTQSNDDLNRAVVKEKLSGTVKYNVNCETSL